MFILLLWTMAHFYYSGTYTSGEPITRISSFSTKLSVIASKQRPRRVALTGEDGKTYEYLLKGKSYVYAAECGGWSQALL
jgi:phosphatidylinositol kinase/protein kinase (PI-3  family)